MKGGWWIPSFSKGHYYEKNNNYKLVWYKYQYYAPKVVRAALLRK
jgi:hypothetical protein